MSRTSTLAMVVATALLGPAALPGAASARTAEPAVAVPEGGALHLTGHGYGHGRGMSQYGAEGAARQGLTSAQIIGFYYPGTTIARA
ncbi:hypothetical protein ACH5WX_11280, partial [Nocardioides sp. CER28]